MLTNVNAGTEPHRRMGFLRLISNSFPGDKRDQGRKK